MNPTDEQILANEAAVYDKLSAFERFAHVKLRLPLRLEGLPLRKRYAGFLPSLIGTWTLVLPVFFGQWPSDCPRTWPAHFQYDPETGALWLAPRFRDFVAQRRAAA